MANKRPLYIQYSGPGLLETPLLNKSSAFTREERRDFNLTGLLPYTMETIEEQVVRAYDQYNLCNNDLERHVYLRSIQDDNETLFFRLVQDHLEEMLPIIYTPTVGQACQEFSKFIAIIVVFSLVIPIKIISTIFYIVLLKRMLKSLW